MPRLIGGALCLDFVNTVDPRHATDRREYLNDYSDLVAWAGHAGSIGPGEAHRLLELARRHRGGAREVLRRAIRLREALYAVFSSGGGRRAPPADALACLNRELADAVAGSRIVHTAEGYSWRWDERRRRLERVLWPVVRSASDLLLQGPLDRVRECPGQGDCGWLFLDISRNAKRRWCDMRSCGNRAKARRHYARLRRSAP